MFVVLAPGNPIKCRQSKTGFIVWGGAQRPSADLADSFGKQQLQIRAQHAAIHMGVGPLRHPAYRAPLAAGAARHVEGGQQQSLQAVKARGQPVQCDYGTFSMQSWEWGEVGQSPLL